MREIKFRGFRTVQKDWGISFMCPTREKQEEKDSCEDAILEWLKGDAE